MRVTHAIVFVSDMRRSVALYRDVFGMALRFQSPGWTEFATEIHVEHLLGPDSMVIGIK